MDRRNLDALPADFAEAVAPMNEIEGIAAGRARLAAARPGRLFQGRSLSRSPIHNVLG